MVAVVLPAQLFASLFVGHAVGIGKFVNRTVEIGVQLLFADAADIGIMRIHGYIVQVVQVTEDADVAEFAYARDESETNAGIQRLQHREEGFQRIAVGSV